MEQNSKYKSETKFSGLTACMQQPHYMNKNVLGLSTLCNSVTVTIFHSSIQMLAYRDAKDCQLTHILVFHEANLHTCMHSSPSLFCNNYSSYMPYQLHCIFQTTAPFHDIESHSQDMTLLASRASLRSHDNSF